MNRTRVITTWIVNCTAIFIVQASSEQTEIAIPTKPIGLDGFSVMREFFNYDRGIPLEARIVDQDNESEYIREKLVFRGIGNSRVPGYLAIPTNGAACNAPYPCVFLIHGIGGSKEDWWSDDSFHSGGMLTKTLLKSGIAVMTLDVEYHGERLANNDFESPEVFLFQKGWSYRARDMIVGSVVEHRRAIDYLETRKEIDVSKIGTVGYSMGGMMVFSLSALDSRIKVSVACVTPILKENYSAIAIHNFAPHIETPPFLMLMGNTDERNYTPEVAQNVLDLVASNKKQLVMFKSGHKLPIEWTERTAQWITENMK